MFIQAITLFPEMFCSITEFGVTGRACQQNIWRFNAINPRQFVDNKLGYIDDRPFGGGVGMVMMAEPLCKAIDSAKQNLSGSLKTIYLSPQGAPLTHQKVVELSQVDNLILLCGRYEGVDERVLQSCIDEEISIGDFVVSGGELPAMMLMDAVLRFVPNVLGNMVSAEQDSFADGLLDYPHYTRPAEFQGMAVPDVLKSGDHALIAEWRLEQSLRRTLLRRPDLLEKRDLIPQEARLLAKICAESNE
ncbi:tRNA (guanosine(37)-N1)-methyltransferase TrmD [Kingella kingae]|uniref:tRNA (guanosine(37)-N1)-methyltransferase TrmD n=1 Tax=Kingella kingae TaxID=504 RepID=UPI00025850DF|nr:tRNA (guanosine(37)-N1)-methyltransferase TrmD [Kingella kingae]EIC13008.1 tRNA (guanine-N(1)-)-methyltransferase [Kingella kingae PYKK081]MDK4569429.1 tRNA (guanosine(37)-N1)-methyltransferase TrmD [Kingella kingae]MDK4571388.1 tRNA (guanosine(37)-N1)-methyltransferase TrmD [Kingella kingae]MDK4573366.1 tRNA (guanosine(37)-N1)-methyltransferase TrmD [Kingella kingae]MDK4599406.1 tRNA (guanosine(37)-N1)-methyltransferase TrmD [Kingella kingae]